MAAPRVLDGELSSWGRRHSREMPEAGTRTIIFAEKPTFVPPGLEWLFEKPADEDGSFRLEFVAETYMTPRGVAGKFLTQDGQLLSQGAIHNETGKAIFLFPTAKTFVRFDMLPAHRERMAGFTVQGFMLQGLKAMKIQTVNRE